MRPLRFVALLLTLALGVQAKDLSAWEAVMGLKKGAPIEVSRKAGGSLQGDFASATADSVTLQSKKGEVSVARSEVASVGVKGRSSHTGKIIGTAAGAVAGLAGGAALGTRLENEGQGDKAAITAGVAAIGAAIGLGIGWGIHGGYSAIYRAK